MELQNLNINDIFRLRKENKMEELKQIMNGTNKLYINKLKEVFPEVPRIEGSTGAGNHANVPWICFFANPEDKASKGLFTALLFFGTKEKSGYYSEKLALVIMEGSNYYKSIVPKLTKQNYLSKRTNWFNNLKDKFSFVKDESDLVLGTTGTAKGYTPNVITYKIFSGPIDEKNLFNYITIFLRNTLILKNKFGIELIKTKLSNNNYIYSNEDKQELNSQEVPKQINKNVNSYKRSNKVKEYVIKREKGICGLCKNCGPFQNKVGFKNFSFLEVAHIIALKEGGKDNITNTVGLCPNCHRKIDHWDNVNEVNKLKNKLKNYITEVEKLKS